MSLEELRAMAHPIRLRVLSLLTGSPMTAAEVARELGLTHANASYHLRQLLAAGTIRVAGEERIRGGQAKRYRYDVDDCDDHGEAAPVHEFDDHSGQQVRQQIYDAVAAELRRRARRVRPGPRRGHLTDAELWVDPAVWEKIRDGITEISQTLHRAAQPARTPGTILVNATIAMFEMDPS